MTLLLIYLAIGVSFLYSILEAVLLSITSGYALHNSKGTVLFPAKARVFFGENPKLYGMKERTSTSRCQRSSP